MGAAKGRELENEFNPPGMSAPMRSAPGREPGPANWPHGDAQPRDGADDRRAPSSTLFEGDVDLIELRRRLAIDPHSIPEPPVRGQRRSVLRLSSVVRLSLYAGLASIVAYGVVEVLLMFGQRPVSSNPSNAVVSAKAELTTGSSAAQRQLDRKDIGKRTPSAGKQDPQRMSWFVRRGLELIEIGDFAAARLVLRPAAEAGDPQAALMLGATFDPAFVAELGALGLAPDPNVARAWYQRAKESGSTEASGRIERLARMSK